LRFAALDGWRGVAAVAVTLFHLSVLGHFFELPFVRKADVFVDFFFVLSGFVLTHAYGDRLSRKEDILRFAIRRFGRLWPLHITTVIVLVAIELAKFASMKVGGLAAGEPPFEGRTGVDALLYNVLLLHGLGFVPDFTWNLPSWSVSTEFYVYAAFAGICLRFGRPSVRVALAVAVLSGALFYSLIVWHVGPPPLYTAVWRCLCEFAIGVAVYQLFRSASQPLLRLTASLEIPFLLVMATVITLSPRNELAFLCPGLFGLAVFIFAPGLGPVSRVLETKPLQVLGEISYSIYLVHFVVLTIFNAFSRALEQMLHVPLRLQFIYDGAPFDVLSAGGPWFLDVIAIGYLAVVIALSIRTYQLIEVPSRDYFNRLANKAGARLFTGDGVGEDGAWAAKQAGSTCAAARAGVQRSNMSLTEPGRRNEI
jgi:peptidoglycan/LPS O-acetylase OafA/YrhL